MKSIRFLTVLASAAAILVAAPKAKADSYSFGTLDVTIWNGEYQNGVTDTATLGSMPTISPIGTYTYDGPLNFVNDNPQTSSGTNNTFLDFFDSNGTTNYLSDLTAVSGDSVSTLENLIMCSGGETGAAINTYMEFTGGMIAGETVTLSSDDGSSLYVNGSTLISMPGPQSQTTTSAVLPAGSNPFTLVYVESNGAPAVLQMSTVTPEPTSLLLLGTGLLGLALVLSRKARQKPGFMAH